MLGQWLLRGGEKIFKLEKGRWGLFVFGSNSLKIIILKNYVYLSIFGCAGSLLLHELFSSCIKGGYSLAVMCGLLTAVASLVEHRSWARGFSSCGSWAQ